MKLIGRHQGGLGVSVERGGGQGVRSRQQVSVTPQTERENKGGTDEGGSK